MTGPSLVPKLGAGRVTAALVIACVIIALAVVLTLVLLLIMAFSSMPAGCGFDSSDACTNPNANDTQIAIMGILIAVCAVGSTTAPVTATTGWVLGAARPVLRLRVLAGFAAVLVIALGVGSVVVGFLVSQAAIRIVLATVVAAVVLAWPIALARVQHIARTQSR